MSKENITGDTNDCAAKEELESDAAPQAQADLQDGRLIEVPAVPALRLLDWNWRSSIGDNFAHGSTTLRCSQTAECTDDDDYFLRNREFADTFTDLNVPRKCPRLGHFAPKTCSSTSKMHDLFNELPDELLLRVFRFMPRARDRASCASVCKRCLKLQSHMQRKDFHCNDKLLYQKKLPKCTSDTKKNGLLDEAHSQESLPRSAKDVCDDIRVERQPQWAMGDLSRSLEGIKATDLRLAAMAVGTGDRGGLDKLCIKSGGHAGVSDEGLSAIGHSCAALQSLILWDCPIITNKSLAVIGEGCRLLRKFEAVKCPLIGDSGVSSIAKSASLLSSLTLDQCPLVGDISLLAVSKGTQALTQLIIKYCPLVGDDGLRAVLLNCRKLQHLKLQGLPVSDQMLMWVNWNCNALSTFGLSSLDAITEDGFLSFCNVASVKGLKRLAVANCPGFNENTLMAVGNSFGNLKQVSLRWEGISDQGLMDLVQSASSLQILHVEKCGLITSLSLMSALSSPTGRLKEVHFKSCEGIQEHNVPVPSPSLARSNSVVSSICLADCGNVGDGCLSLIGSLCNHQLRDLDLTGITRATDEGFLSILEWCQFSNLNFTSCVKLTDITVIAIARKCGKSLESLILDGCRSVTDRGLKAIGECCVALEDLDVSECDITDVGVHAVISTTGSTLTSLNLSGCGGVTNQIFSVIEEGCPSLKDLSVKDCSGLTPRAISKLSDRIWECNL